MADIDKDAIREYVRRNLFSGKMSVDGLQEFLESSEGSGRMYDDGGELTPMMKDTLTPWQSPAIDESSYNRFLKTLPDNLRNTNESDYRMRRYWELNGRPVDFMQAVGKGMFHKEDDGLYHANSVAETTDGNYEFMKYPNHPTLLRELEWYNSKDGEEFKRDFDLDTMSKPYYQYIRKANGGSLNIESTKGNHNPIGIFNDTVYKVPAVRFDEGGVLTEDIPITPRTIKWGSPEYENNLKKQQALISLGYTGITPDGSWGPNLEAIWQRHNNSGIWERMVREATYDQRYNNDIFGAAVRGLSSLFPVDTKASPVEEAANTAEASMPAIEDTLTVDSLKKLVKKYNPRWTDAEIRKLYRALKESPWGVGPALYSMMGESGFRGDKNKFTTAVGLGQLTDDTLKTLFPDEKEYRKVRKEYDEGRRSLSNQIDDTFKNTRRLYDRIAWKEDEKPSYGRLKINILSPNKKLEDTIGDDLYTRSLTRTQQKYLNETKGGTTYQQLLPMYDDEYSAWVRDWVKNNSKGNGGNLFDKGGDRKRKKAAEEAFWRNDMDTAKKLAVYKPRIEPLYESSLPEVTITPEWTVDDYNELMKQAKTNDLKYQAQKDFENHQLNPTYGDLIEQGINQTIPFVGMANSGLHQLRSATAGLFDDTYEQQMQKLLAERAADASLIPTGTTLAAMTGNPWVLGAVEGGFLGEALHDIDTNGLNNENAASLAMASIAPGMHFTAETMPYIGERISENISPETKAGLDVLRESPQSIPMLMTKDGKLAFNIAKDNYLNTKGTWDGGVDPSYFYHNTSSKYYSDHPYAPANTDKLVREWVNGDKKFSDDLYYFGNKGIGELNGVRPYELGMDVEHTPKTIIEDTHIRGVFPDTPSSHWSLSRNLTQDAKIWRLDPRTGRYYRSHEEVPRKTVTGFNNASYQNRDLVDSKGNVNWDRFYRILDEDKVFTENALVNKAIKSDDKAMELYKLLENKEITEEEYNRLLAEESPRERTVGELMESQVNSSGNLKKHIEDVVKSAQSFPLPKGVSRKEFVTAALWHDVGKLIDYRNHGAVSADVMNRHLKEVASTYEWGDKPTFNLKDIENAIRNHMSTETYYDRGLTKALQAADVARGNTDAMDFGASHPNIMGWDNGIKPTYKPMSPQEEINTINKVFKKLGIEEIDPSIPENQWEKEIADRLMKARSMTRGTSVPPLTDRYKYGPNTDNPVTETVLKMMSGRDDINAAEWIRMSEKERSERGLPTFAEFNKLFAEYPVTSQEHGRYNYEAGDADKYKSGRYVGNSEYMKAQKGPFDALYISNDASILENYGNNDFGKHVVGMPVIPREKGESLRSWIQRNMIDSYNSGHKAIIDNPENNPMMGPQQLFEIPHLLQTGEDIGEMLRNRPDFPETSRTLKPEIQRLENMLFTPSNISNHLKSKYDIDLPDLQYKGKKVSYSFLENQVRETENIFKDSLKDMDAERLLDGDTEFMDSFGFSELSKKGFATILKNIADTDPKHVRSASRRSTYILKKIIEDTDTHFYIGLESFPPKIRNLVADAKKIVHYWEENPIKAGTMSLSQKERDAAIKTKTLLEELKNTISDEKTWNDYYTEDVKENLLKSYIKKQVPNYIKMTKYDLDDYTVGMKDPFIMDYSKQASYLMDRRKYLDIMKDRGTVPRYMQEDFNNNRAYITRSEQIGNGFKFDFNNQKTGTQGYVVGPADGSRQILWETPFENSFLKDLKPNGVVYPIGQFFNFRKFGGNLNEGVDSTATMKNLFYDGGPDTPSLHPTLNRFMHQSGGHRDLPLVGLLGLRNKDDYYYTGSYNLGHDLSYDRNKEEVPSRDLVNLFLDGNKEGFEPFDGNPLVMDGKTYDLPQYKSNMIPLEAINLRPESRKAIEAMIDSKKFLKFNSGFFSDSNLIKNNPYLQNYNKILDDVNNANIVFKKDKDGNIYADIFDVWDYNGSTGIGGAALEKIVSSDGYDNNGPFILRQHIPVGFSREGDSNGPLLDTISKGQWQKILNQYR